MQVELRREIIAGITTFLTMAYIIFVNPLIVGSGFEIALKNALGVQALSPEQVALVNSVKVGIATATILAASFGSILMALYARLPFAMAPGMGENSFIGFSVIPAFTSVLIGMGIRGWQAVSAFIIICSARVHWFLRPLNAMRY
jgi:AGZA family xanthine/uracil permease-like MFS transporter